MLSNDSISKIFFYCLPGLYFIYFCFDLCCFLSYSKSVHSLLLFIKRRKSSLRYKVRLFIWGSSFFLMQVFIAIFLLSTIFFSMLIHYIFIFIALRLFHIFLLISSSIHWIFRSVLFNIHIFVNIPVFLLLLILVSYHVWKRHLVWFQLSKFPTTYFVLWQMIYPEECSMYAWVQDICSADLMWNFRYMFVSPICTRVWLKFDIPYWFSAWKICPL